MSPTDPPGSRPPLAQVAPVTESFHRWYYENEIWDRTFWMGVPCLKSVLDLWNYQEIIFEISPAFVIEVGAYLGGSTLFFSTVLEHVNPAARVLVVETKPERISERSRSRPNVEILTGSSLDPDLADTLRQFRDASPGPIFMILDSKHGRDHVLAEMLNFRSLLRCGDYLVVEDTNVNGHPVLPDHGPGPMEAVRAYEERFPGDYEHDVQREAKFGFTFAPYGMLRRISG